MTELINTEVTPEQIDKHFSALNDSVALINSLISAGNKSEENVSTVKRNYEHIDIMLAKDFIVNDGRDKSSIIAASAAGKEFVA